jgi:hypothetical protein
MTRSETIPNTRRRNPFLIPSAQLLPVLPFRVFRGLIVFSLCSLNLLAADTVLYENNFEKEEIGKVPAEFMVLDGGFVVKEEAGNKFLELPGAPLDSFAVQFGPTESSDLSVSARIYATAKGRRFPTFGVGLDGVAGYKLQSAPGKKALELLKDQKVLATVPYDWKSAEWLNFRLQVVKTGDSAWKIAGKVWPHESAEPSAWTISADEKEEPLAGRPSVFGSPFSGTPIWYDDLRVEKVRTK